MLSSNTDIIDKDVKTNLDLNQNPTLWSYGH